ncbi:MAG: arylsulfatase [Verrucomicrobia bacterium]|nr:arylsulfatase [Verrucomicrobiota bacterium]
MKSTLLRLAVISTIVSGLFVASASAAAPARKPNIIFILADDLGYGDVGAFGQKRIRTPNLDRMAAQGMRLTHHYAGNAVCAPSRCVLMTGKHPGHAFVRNNRQADNAKGISRTGQPEFEGQFPIPAATVTVPKLLKAQGYVTGGFGKWGLGGPGSTGEPLKQGFDRWFGYNCQGVAHNFYPTYLWDNDKTIALKNPPFPSADKFNEGEDPTKPESYRRFQGTEYSADLIAEQALAFVRANKANPFYLYWPTTVPHLALQVPDDSLKEYLGQWSDPPYAGGKGYLPHFAPRAAYAAMVTRMDREIGRLMELVKELGLDENTLFVFSSDNGPLHGTHEGLAGTDANFFNSAGGLRDGKGSLWEGGFREPTIVRWAGKIKPGTTSERVSGFEDWLPTLIEVAGAKSATPKDTDGISLLPTLLGQKQAERPFLYREFPAYGGQQCVRVGDWKAIRRNLTGGNPPAKGAKAKAAPGSSRLELYNLRDDPAETTDVAAKHPDLVAKLEGILREQHVDSAEFPFPALDKRGKSGQ